MFFSCGTHRKLFTNIPHVTTSLRISAPQQMSSPIETYRALILADVVSASEGSFFVGLAEEGLNSFVQGRDVKIFITWLLLNPLARLIQMFINLHNCHFKFFFPKAISSTNWELIHLVGVSPVTNQ